MWENIYPVQELIGKNHLYTWWSPDSTKQPAENNIKLLEQENWWWPDIASKDFNYKSEPEKYKLVPLRSNLYVNWQ